MGAAEQTTDERVDELERWRSDIEQRFSNAFPSADYVGHCRYHELMIEDISTKKRLHQAILEKTISGLVWAAVVGMTIAGWHWLKAALK